MKPRETSPTRGLVGIASHALLCSSDFEEVGHLKLSLSAKQGAEMLGKIKLRPGKLKQRGHLGNMISKFFLAVKIKKLMELDEIWVATRCGAIGLALCLQLRGESLKDDLINESIRPCPDPAWLILGGIEIDAVDPKQCDVKLILESLPPLFRDGAQVIIDRAESFTGRPESKDQLNPELLRLLSRASEGEKEDRLVEVQKVEPLWPSTFGACGFSGFNPENSKAFEFSDMSVNHLPKMLVGEAERGRDISGIDEEFRAAVMDREELIHEGWMLRGRRSNGTLKFRHNVKARATLPAAASGDHRVWVVVRENHRN